MAEADGDLRNGKVVFNVRELAARKSQMGNMAICTRSLIEIQKVGPRKFHETCREGYRGMRAGLLSVIEALLMNVIT